jgi:hypothetical protein
VLQLAFSPFLTFAQYSHSHLSPSQLPVVQKINNRINDILMNAIMSCSGDLWKRWVLSVLSLYF